MPGRARAARRVLVVDDNVDGAESLGLLLRAMGHEVQVVHDGAAALAAAKDRVPEVAFVDIVMPGMNGYELARRLRRDWPPAALRIYAMSGIGQDENRELGEEAGIEQFLVKPLEPGMLERLLGRR